MHPTTEELLDLRDGEGAEETARHLEQCDQCCNRLEDLRAVSSALKELAQVPPPEASWTEIRKRAIGKGRRPVDLQVGIAAAVLLAVAVAAMIGHLGVGDGFPERAESAGTREAIEQLSSASRELELLLRDSSLQSPVLSTQTAAMIVEIEDRIAVVDMILAQSSFEQDERTVALWSDRVELLDALIAARSGQIPTGGIVRAVNERSQR
ncbi:MAG: hypothetical protein P8127_01325 [Acidobacteriota bacterium]|jgi:hypothetical protein